MPDRVGRTATGRPYPLDPNDPQALDQALRQQEAFFGTILDDLPTMVSRWLPDGSLTFANRALCEFFGLDHEDLIGNTFFPWLPEEQRQTLEAQVANFTPEQPTSVMVNRLPAAGGELRWTRWTNRALFDERGRLSEIQSVGEDITQQVAAEEASEAIRRSRRALGTITQVVTRAPDETTLLEQACEAIVQETGYEMAWVGFPVEDAERTFRIAAHGGDDHGYLDQLNVSWDAHRPEGQGPTARAFRTSRPVAVHQLQSDPLTRPWHSLAARAGMVAGAALPLWSQGEALGALSIYSTLPRAFGEEELGLLQELADEVAYALASLRTRAEQQYTAGQRDRLAAILDATPDFVGIADAAGNILYHNEAARQFLGIDHEPGRGSQTAVQAHPEHEAQRLQEEAFPTAIRDGIWQGEIMFRDKGGHEVPFSQTILAHYAENSEVTHLSTIARDISEQKEREGALRRQFFTAVEVFGNLLELRAPTLASHCQRVVEKAVQIAHALGVPEQETDDLYFAALLHEVGKVGMSEQLLNKPYALLTSSERKRIKQHPVLGEAALMALEPLDRPARLIRQHCEYLDGSGFPDRLEGKAIRRGARILTVVNDFDDLCNSRLYVKSLSQPRALEVLQRYKGQLYDPAAVDALAEIVQWGSEPSEAAEPSLPGSRQAYDRPKGEESPTPRRRRSPRTSQNNPATPFHRPERKGHPAKEAPPKDSTAPRGADASTSAPQEAPGGEAEQLSGWQLQPGLVLAEDLVTQEGMLLLSRDRPLDDRAIKKIRALERRFGRRFEVWVYKEVEPIQG